ncbi:MAG: RsmB/NOP family class I SAM-dependent RNA methyltransferase [Spirochaetia bacterium]
MSKNRIDFDEYYRGLFGSRWENLREAMFLNRPHYQLKERLKKTYYLDEASHTAARALLAAPGSRVLDLCAAPGGKTLVIAGMLTEEGELTVNDRSAARTARLKRVLTEHLESEMLSNIRITCRDASRWGLYEQNAYDRVLCDVPCSSESHILSSPEHLKRWSPRRSKRLSVEQYAILASGITAVKPGGIVLYSTCALSPLENDRVIEKAVKRWGKKIKVDDVSAPWGEKTGYGWRIWPDRSGGRGPIYFSRIRKLEPDG